MTTPTGTAATVTQKACTKCGQVQSTDQFYRVRANADGLDYWCKGCNRAYAQQRKAALATSPAAVKTALEAALAKEAAAAAEAEKPQKAAHKPLGYLADPALLRLWAATQVRRSVTDHHPLTLMFLGPSGSGKTHAAQHLAEIAATPFTKVDAAAMTDPEAWFGTREVIAREGVSVTAYRPSTFVQAIQQPGVLLIDEANRIRDEHRNILLPLLDGTHQITNPLTGELVRKHPECYIILSGNEGLQYTGTFPMDPALLTRCVVVRFAYLAEPHEMRVAMDRTGCDEATAKVFVRFANETRQRAVANPDMQPVSTREVLAACLLAPSVGNDLAARYAIINQASTEGGADSVASSLEKIWVGVRAIR